VRESEKLIADLPAYAKNAHEDLNDWVSRKPFFEAWRVRLFPRFAASTNKGTATNATVLQTTNAVADTNAPVLPSQKAPENVWGARFSESVLAWISEAAPVVGNWLWSQATRVASWAGMIIGIAMVPVFTYYFLQEKEKIRKGWTNYLPLQESRLKEELVFVLNSINNYLIVFFRGQVLIALCNGVMLTIGFLIMGLNYALLLGLLAGMLSIVPYLGTVVTIVPTIILAAVQFRDLFHPLMVVVIFSVVHLMEGFVISPKIMGDRVGLHPLTIIVAVLVGTTLLGGILGGILAIPLTAALRVVMFRYIWKPRATAVTQ
jgi:predicted PurR-regulated permease PerM